MGLPAWSSVGYGSEEKPSISKPDPPATRRSPIRRRSPSRVGSFRHPEPGDVRGLRRYLERRGAPSRSIPPHAPVPQHRRPYRPVVHSPLVPSIPPGVDEQLQVAIDAIERACAESIQISSEAAAIARPYSHPSLRDLLSDITQASERFHDLMQEHLTSLEQWEHLLRRNDEGHNTDWHRTFTSMIVSFIQACDDGLGVLRDRRARFREESRQYLPSRPTELEPGQSLNEPPALQRAPGATPGRRRNAAGMRREPHWTISRIVRVQHESGGLGDRTRSASPDHDADAWDTMQMTLEPDEHLPTADSSFTTAAASASFSAPTDSSRSSVDPDSANSSRTSVTVPPVDDTACDSDDSLVHQHDDLDPLDYSGPPSFPEVIPSPLAPRHAFNSARTQPSNNDRERPLRSVRRQLPWVDRPPAPTWSARIGRDTPPAGPASNGRLTPVVNSVSPGNGYQYHFMPRSQSPLDIASHHQSSAEVTYSLELPNETDFARTHRASSPSRVHVGALPRRAEMPRWTTHLHVSPPPDALTTRATSEDRRSDAHPRLADSIPAVVRLALRYAERVSSLDDQHADPDLEHMRTMLQSLASDGHINMNDDEMWMGAGLASMVAENNSSRFTNRTPRLDEPDRFS